MSIKQHFARWKETEAAKLRPMTAKQRAGYILHYYRFWFIGLALLLLVGFYIGDAVIQSHKEILLQGFFTNDEYNLFPAEQIEKEAVKRDLDVSILLEVNVAGEESKFGFAPEEVEEAAREIAKYPHVHIQGLMTIAPFVENSEENRGVFKKLYELYVDMKRKNIDNVTMNVLSMGMTGDYQTAIEEGATMVRVGTGIFGTRAKIGEK